MLGECINILGPEADAGGEAVDEYEGGPARGTISIPVSTERVTHLAAFIGVLIVLMWCLPPLIGTMRCSSGVFTTSGG